MTFDPSRATVHQPLNASEYEAGQRLRVFVRCNVPSCLNCMWFREHKGEVCEKLPTPARPPARVIAYGCDAHEFDIPF